VGGGAPNAPRIDIQFLSLVMTSPEVQGVARQYVCRIGYRRRGPGLTEFVRRVQQAYREVNRVKSPGGNFVFSYIGSIQLISIIREHYVIPCSRSLVWETGKLACLVSAVWPSRNGNQSACNPSIFTDSFL